MPDPSGLQAAHDRYMRGLEARERGALNRLARGYAEAWRVMRDQLVANVARIQRAQASPDGIVPLDLVLRDQRLRALLEQSETEIRRLGSLGAEIAEELQRFAAESAVRDSDEAMRAAWRDRLSAILDPDTRRALRDMPSWARIPTEALQDLYGFTADGSPLATLFDAIGPQARAGWESALVQGLARGLNPRDVAAMAQRATATGMARAMTIARTEMLRAYRQASGRNYQANSDVVREWVWISAGERRTCAACLGLHGSIHPVTEVMSSHPNCRCSMAPRTRTLKEILGVDIPGDDSQISVPTGDSIFSRLSDDDQRVVLGGPGALAAWKAGEVELRDFIGQRRSPVWGDSHYQRSLRDARAAADERRRRAPPTPPPPAPKSPRSPRNPRAPRAAAPVQGKPGTPVRPSRAGPHASSVSGALNMEPRISGAYGNDVGAAIDRVHGDGPLSPIPVTIKRMPKGRQGQFATYGSGTPAEINMRAKPDHPRLTLAHEIGHWLDQSGIGRNGAAPTSGGHGQVTRWLSIWPDKAPAEMVAWKEAVDKSDARGQLANLQHQMRTKKHIEFTTEDGTPNMARLSPTWLAYSLRTEELWARSYAQYIAVRSGDAGMMAELRTEQAEQRRMAVPITTQWQDADFAPIARAMDALFAALGWLH